jgi:TPR repeat protein
MYRTGKGVQKDEKEAVEWYKQSAIQGYAKAQNYLAAIYCVGIGILQDLKQCSFWAQKADENGQDVKELWEHFELWKYEE